MKTSKMKPDGLSDKNIALEIVRLNELIENELACCGDNILFPNKISKQLFKLDPYNLQRLYNIIQTAIVMKRLEG